MATLREVITRLKFQVDESGINRMNAGMRSVRNQTREAGRAARKTTDAFAGIGVKILEKATQFAKRSIKAFTTDFAASTDEAAKTAKQFDILVGSLQGFRFAANLAGASQGDLDTGFRTIAKRLRDANRGLKTQQQAFADVGIKANELKGLKVDQIVLRVADRFKNMTDATAKAALAQELFGRSGVKLIPLLNQGSAAIRAQMKDAKGLGIVLDTEAAKKAEKFQDQMLRAKSAISGVRNAIALELLPKLSSMLQRFADWIKQGDNLQRTVNGVKTAFKVLGATLLAIQVFKLGPLGAALAVFGLIFKELSKSKEGMQALKDLGKAFGDVVKPLAPIFLQIVTAIKPIIPVMASVITEVAKLLAFVLKELGPIFISVIKFIAKFFVMAVKGWIIIIKFLGKIWKAVVKAVRPFVIAIGKAFKFVGGVVTGVVSTISSAFRGLFNFIKPAISFIGKAFKFALQPIIFIVAKIAGAFKFVLGIIKKVAKFAVKVANNPVVKAFLGTGQAGAFAQGIIKSARAQAAASKAKSTSNSIGNVNVNISGSTGMNAEQIKKAVSAGISNAAQQGFRDLEAAQ